ncbi:hypothetical protein LTR36_001288 [Oleoguttula mirabilis]|uniref:Septin-type G domain-containing protein n=1 Tax=Oleoguttula mirabilis TaxID=1507867 RepID=A0AAV9JPW7_9PEZI|nr:hypothetical protein LTR36_001288 [Oleoguttula mirabilis]
MSASQSYDARTIKGKKPAANPPSMGNPGHSGPTTFFLKSEKDIERSTQRGRKASRSSAGPREEPLRTPSVSDMGDSSFGVESLADTINSAFASDSTLSRTNSNSTEPSVEAGAEVNTPAGRKRKPRNPVHPSIVAAGQRILSNERPSAHALSQSPASLRSSESPYRSHLRRGSAASSINMNSQPLTPLRLSPQPDSAMPSTPRSGSPKSFRLSDEEGSVLDETGSQVIQSSNGEDDEDGCMEESKGSSMPQLVMPSIAMPTRRPFTEKGRRMGRVKIMVVGHNGAGKTSLIQSILRSCDDVVHVDSAVTNTINNSPSITETHASTRPYPSWWTDFENRRMLLRRKSVGDGVLERNICLVDTPGLDEESDVQQVLRYFNSTQLRTASLEKMTDSELINLLSGDGGVQIDAALWLFDPATVSSASASEMMPDGPQRFLFQVLCRSTNLIPLVGQTDTLAADEIAVCREKVATFMQSIAAEPYTFPGIGTRFESSQASEDKPSEPLAVSSALADDVEEVDASVLMSSQYVQPLVPSELGYLVEQLLDPDNIARMRHFSASKFLLWRQQHLGAHIDLHKQTLLRSPRFGNTLPSVTSTGSLLEEQSKVLVPHSTSSYYRSASPSPSDFLALSGNGVGTSAYALAHHNDQTQGTEPFRQVRLAKWAQDLQRSLNNERKRYTRLYANPAADWTTATSDAEKDDHEKVLTAAHHRPARGRLGGDIAIIDPQDPLGVLAFGQAFRRRGWVALQIAGGMGVAFWVVRNWAEVQEWFGARQPVFYNAPAVPAPTRGLMGYVEDIDWKGFFGWDR